LTFDRGPTNEYSLIEISIQFDSIWLHVNIKKFFSPEGPQNIITFYDHFPYIWKLKFYRSRSEHNDIHIDNDLNISCLYDI